MTKPLYQQAQDGDLGDSQYMDIETVAWIAAQHLEAPATPLAAALHADDLRMLGTLVPRPSYFLNQDTYNSIHGVRHIMRVAALALLLSRSLNVDPRDNIVAASVHDVRRRNDRRDAGHGARAAQWFAQTIASLPTHQALMQDQQTVEMSVRYHDTDYPDIPSEVLATSKQSIDILKAADALDRYRQPDKRWWPKLEYIELEIATPFMFASRQLVVDSERLALSGEDPANAVLTAAKQLFTK